MLTNQVLGEELADPTQALGESARAAALITQGDLVTEFKAVGQMTRRRRQRYCGQSRRVSPAWPISRQILGTYTRSRSRPRRSRVGDHHAVDDITVLAGTGKLVSVNDIIGNDRNTGEGDLRLISIGPSKVTFTEVKNVMTARMSELGSEIALTALRSR